MNVLVSTWRQLVQRRLLPVAGLLMAALVAVPVVLAKDPKPAAPLTPAAGEAAEDGGVAKPVVALRTDQPVRARRVLGARKDPFAPAPLPKTRKKTATAVRSTAGGATKTESLTKTTKDAVAAGSGASGSVPAGGSGTTAAPTATTPAPAGTPAPAQTVPLYSLSVRFGDAASDSLDTLDPLKRLEPLPDADDPVLVYLGVEDGGKTAVFLVDAAAQVDGDGRCDPDPSDCETLRMRQGDTEFVTVPASGAAADTSASGGTQYELDVVKIHRGSTTSASASASAAGRKLLRAHVARQPLHWRYDPTTGTLRHLAHAKRHRF